MPNNDQLAKIKIKNFPLYDSKNSELKLNTPDADSGVDFETVTISKFIERVKLLGYYHGNTSIHGKNYPEILIKLEDFIPKINEETNHWEICGTDTGVAATGNDGKPGQNGSNGSNGQEGAPGNGIASIVVTYGGADEYTPDGTESGPVYDAGQVMIFTGWSGSLPSNQWKTIWIKITINLDNGDSTYYLYPAGENGNDGLPGAAGSSITAISISNGVQPTDRIMSFTTNNGSVIPNVNFTVPQGPKGDTGNNGISATFNSATSTALPYTSSPTVSISETSLGSNSYNLNFGIPQGEPGTKFSVHTYTIPNSMTGWTSEVLGDGTCYTYLLSPNNLTPNPTVDLPAGYTFDINTNVIDFYYNEEDDNLLSGVENVNNCINAKLMTKVDTDYIKIIALNPTAFDPLKYTYRLKFKIYYNPLVITGE